MYSLLRKSLLIPFLYTIAAAQGATLRVPAQYSTIQRGIDAAQNGDVVRVAPGIYFENLDFHGKAIGVVSESGPGFTVIDGQNAGAVVTFTSGETRSSVLSGFTIRNGFSPYGSGISLVSSSATIVSNIFETNNIDIGYWGAAIGGNAASPDIEKNIFRYNSTDDQGGVVGFVNTSSPLIANNIFYENPGRAIDLTLPEGSSPVVVNNTIVRNRLGVRVDGRVDSSALSFFNNIVAENGVGLFVEFGWWPTWGYNLVGGNGTNYLTIADQTGLNGNISGMPSFFSPDLNDFRLLPGSLGIDAGDNLAPQLPTDDFRGYRRIIAGQVGGAAIVDMGAYEFDPVAAPGARQIQSAVLDDLTGFITNQVTGAVLLNKAIKNLEGGLDERFWIDDLHIDARFGGRVFVRQAQAVSKLKQLMNKKSDQLPEATLQEWIAELVSAGRLLAEVELEETRAVVPVGTKLVRAAKELASGDNAANRQNYSGAIAHYAIAWQLAEQANKSHQ